MNMLTLVSALKGYRTYLATGATILTAVATIAGLMPLEKGAIVAAVCVALAQAFQRLATADAQNLLGQAVAEIERLRNLFDFEHTPQPETVDWDATGNSPKIPPAALAVLLSLCVAGTAIAQDGVSIIGPSDVQAPGLPCELHLQGIASAKNVTIAWKVFPPVPNVRMIEARDGGTVARLTTIAGRWSILCAYHIEGEPIRFVTHETTVPGTPYTPPPGPSPTPPNPVPNPNPPTPPTPPEPKPPAPPMPTPPEPDPTPKPPAPAPLPPGEFNGLPARVKDLVEAVNSPSRKAEATKLADAIEAIAAQISAGTLSGPQNIVNALGAALNANTTPAWDESRAKMVDALKALYLAGKLKTPAAWATLLRDVVMGIRAA